jgi:hypothetical protein
MIALVYLVLAVLASQFKSKSRLAAENTGLRHRLIVLRRKVRGRAQLTNSDRRFFIRLYRWFSLIRQALTIIRPETLVRWNRMAFAAIGVGSRGREEGGHRLRRIFALPSTWSSGEDRISFQISRFGFAVYRVR